MTHTSPLLPPYHFYKQLTTSSLQPPSLASFVATVASHLQQPASTILEPCNCEKQPKKLTSVHHLHYDHNFPFLVFHFNNILYSSHPTATQCEFYFIFYANYILTMYFNCLCFNLVLKNLIFLQIYCIFIYVCCVCIYNFIICRL